MALQANPNRNLLIDVDGVFYVRYPVKTKLITPEDKDIAEIIWQYAHEFVESGDIVFISEKSVAVTQGRSYPISEIKASAWAKFLSSKVQKNPAGIGLSIPETMQLAIEEVGLARILLAAVLSAITKVLGFKGVFYHLAGRQAASIDGPVPYAIPPYNTYASKGPAEPQKVIALIEQKSWPTRVKFAIVDANDLGVDILGMSSGLNKKFLQKVLRDNPLGQSDECTPVGIIRMVIGNQ